MKTFDKIKWQREHRRKTGNSDMKKYEKTPKGFLMRLYRNMQSRIEGVQPEKHHLYIGKPLLTREEFYEWAMNGTDFYILFSEYHESGFERKKSPSVDRIDSSKGYELTNMEWVTMSENSRRGAFSKHSLEGVK